MRETRYDSDGDPYSWYICYVTLENKNLSHLPLEMMGEEQMARYSLYMSTLGNRPDLFPESAYVGKYITNPPTDYDVPEARRRNTWAIPMCGAAALRPRPLTAPALCPG